MRRIRLHDRVIMRCWWWSKRPTGRVVGLPDSEYRYYSVALDDGTYIAAHESELTLCN